MKKENQKFLIGWKKPNGIYTEKLTLSEVFNRDNSDLKSCTPSFVLEFTGHYDMDGEEIYDRDILLGLNIGFLVEWNQQQSGWHLKPLEVEGLNPLVKDDFFMLSLEYQRLGDGYLKRRDLTRNDNIFVNPDCRKKYHLD